MIHETLYLISTKITFYYSINIDVYILKIRNRRPIKFTTLFDNLFQSTFTNVISLSLSLCKKKQRENLIAKKTVILSSIVMIDLYISCQDIRLTEKEKERERQKRVYPFIFQKTKNSGIVLLCQLIESNRIEKHGATVEPWLNPGDPGSSRVGNSGYDEAGGSLGSLILRRNHGVGMRRTGALQEEIKGSRAGASKYKPRIRWIR